MAENKMEQVAALFGKKLGEVFIAKLYSEKFQAKFEYTGIYGRGIHSQPDDENWSKARDGLLMELVRGECEIVER